MGIIETNSSIQAEAWRFEVDDDDRVVVAEYTLDRVSCVTRLRADSGRIVVPGAADTLKTLRAAQCVPDDLSDPQARDAIAELGITPEQLLLEQPFMAFAVASAELLLIGDDPDIDGPWRDRCARIAAVTHDECGSTDADPDPYYAAIFSARIDSAIAALPRHYRPRATAVAVAEFGYLAPH